MSHDHDGMPGEAADEIHSMSYLSAGMDPLGAALRAAKREAAPAGLEGRIATRLGVPLVGAGLAATVPAGKVAVVATKGMTGLALKLAALAAVGVGLGVGGAYVVDSVRTSPAAARSPGTAVGAVETARATAAAPSPGTRGEAAGNPASGEETARATAGARLPGTGGAATPPQAQALSPAASAGIPPAGGAPSLDSLAAEAALLTEARNALAAGNVGAAGAALGRHRTSYPGGALALERNVLDLEVRAKSGDRAVAAEAARLAEDPRYRPYQQRLRTLAAGPGAP